nr:hypothetical protein [Mycoplasmopsis synoviae]
MIAKLTYDAKWKITKKASGYIYIGINTDSERFLYPATSKQTYKLVAYLMENGFHPDYILKQMTKRSFKQLKFVGHLLSNFKKEKKVLYYYVDLKTQEKFQMNSFEIAMFVNEMANIENNLIWVLFIQLEDKKIRGRIRSSGSLVNEIAKRYNGAGMKTQLALL